MLDDIGQDLDEAREALQAALDARVAPGPVRQAVARLDRIAADLEAVEGTLGGQVVAAQDAIG